MLHRALRILARTAGLVLIKEGALSVSVLPKLKERRAECKKVGNHFLRLSCLQLFCWKCVEPARQVLIADNTRN